MDIHQSTSVVFFLFFRDAHIGVVIFLDIRVVVFLKNRLKGGEDQTPEVVPYPASACREYAARGLAESPRA